ncbi:sugar-transfer associated ATP-grasp domain-containing protein [Gaetbulibacter sp. M240]|uniref:sugar-transfer associated ATP-grasp domain-containing protein n=1 Tax=Gaetbulibacter sp. M240 TaxID=3126511 RepID=UPI00374E4936
MTKSQIKDIKTFFSSYGFEIKPTWHNFYFASNNIYSVKYIPEDLFHAVLSRKFNQMRQWPTLLDKNLLDVIFKDFKQPEVVIKNINGFYFHNGKIISEEQAIDVISKVSDKMVIKPSIESGNGQNVVSFTVKGNRTSHNNLNFKDLLNNYKKDFIIQLVVIQNEITKSLNESSLNTLRVLSFLDNSGVHNLSTIFRIGKKGEFTDNFESGGIGCGVDSKGRLKKYGYFENGNRTTKTDNGILIENFEIPSYERVLKQVQKMHLLIPYFRLVSWDIGIGQNGEPVLIEYNTYHQGITVHQLANGPLFGSFTDEILYQSV